MGENVRLKAGNLKKVLTGIQDYNADVLGIKFNQSFTLPDIQAAAQGDKQHLSKWVFLKISISSHYKFDPCIYTVDQPKSFFKNVSNSAGDLGP